MNNQELNTALYEKMFAEQDTYRKWLLTQSPEEILNHTYELCNSDCFKVVRVGRVLRISKVSFDNWLDNFNQIGGQ